MITCPFCGMEIQAAAKVCRACWKKLSTDPSSAVPGTQNPADGIISGLALGQFLIGKEMGRGGNAHVFRAQDTFTKQPVIIKTLPIATIHDAEWVSRFNNEALIATKLAHPNIIKILGIFKTDIGQPYFVMEFLSGGRLNERLKAGVMEWDSVVKIVSEILSALECAHAKGIVHQDIKPHNILFNGTGNAILTDFGSAQASIGARILFVHGNGLSVPYYLSPEQCRESDVDPRSDVYSLGVVMYQMLTGTLPFGGKNDQAIRDAHINKLPAPPISRKTSIPAAVQAIVLKALAKTRKDRFSGASEFLRALHAIEVKKVARKQPVDGKPTHRINDIPPAIRLTPGELSHKASVIYKFNLILETLVGKDGGKRCIILVLVLALTFNRWTGQYLSYMLEILVGTGLPGFSELEVRSSRKVLEKKVVSEEPERSWPTIRNSIGMKLVLIPPGTFLMGASDDLALPDEKPIHKVTISRPFLMGIYEVTQGEYKFVMGVNPSRFSYHFPTYPVEQVSWGDAVAFCQKLTRMEKRFYRLPTEAEWEFACRAGTKGAFAGDIKSIGWCDRDSIQGGRWVGSQEPNEWGLYDMHGNVAEWCQDRYNPGFYRSSPATDPCFIGTTEVHVSRGGAWNDKESFCRSSSRGHKVSTLDWTIGFRVVAEVLDADLFPSK